MLRLPYPVSANRYWRHFKGRTVISREAEDYRREVRALAVGVTPIEDGGVWMEVTLHPKLTSKGLASKTCVDLDNALKVLLDALQGIVLVNDRQVRDIHLVYGDPIQDGGVTITWGRMTHGAR